MATTKIIDNSVNLVKSNPIVLYSIIILCILVVLYSLYSTYNKIRKNQLKQPIIIRKPVNSKKPLVLNNAHIPVSHTTHGYSMTVWLWIDDWSYDYGKWKHVLHRGNQNASIVQPGVWLHPTRNELYVSFDSSNRQPGYGPILNNQLYSELLSNPGTLGPKNFLLNKTLGESKKWCMANSKCKGFSFISKPKQSGSNTLSDHSNLIMASYPNQTYNVVNTPTSVQKRYKQSNITSGTIEKQTSLPSLNPSVTNIKNNPEMYTVIKDLPLGRWFNLGIVVNTYSAEVYLDGTLIKTTNLDNPFKENNGHLYISQNGGFSGLTNQLRYYNSSMTQIQIKNIYDKGPNPWMLPDLNNYLKKLQSSLNLNIQVGNFKLGLGNITNNLSNLSNNIVS